MYSMDSEGTDGTTPVAGGITDSTTADLAKKTDVDITASLRGHSCYEAVSALGDAVFTGNTGTNILYVPELDKEKKEDSYSGR